MSKPGEEDAEEIRQVFSGLSDGLKDLAGVIPELIQNSLAAVYSEEAAKSQGRAVATYYTSLKESGMSEELVERLVLDYVISFRDLMNIIQEAVNAESGTKSSGDGEEGEKAEEEGEKAEIEGE